MEEASPSKKAVPKACLQCRTVKMRCVVGGLGATCERCARKSLNCVFREHRRGRKPGTLFASPNIPKRTSEAGRLSVPPPLRAAGTDNQTTVSVENAQLSPSQRLPDWDNGTLQPAGLFNRQTARGGFSMSSILDVSEPCLSETQPEVSAIVANDPIRLGLVNLPIALSLFEDFMTSLNPYISQLDPQLHTFTRVREKSSFLLTTTIGAAAKAFNPALAPKLREHAENLLSEHLRRGTKSIETAQAIMIMTYWKDPDDTRAWMHLGYVIRMAMEMGWHRLVSYQANRADRSTEFAMREARNVERTWLVLFVYDRSIGLQTGKPWMIERSGFIESVESWCRDPMAITNDRLLGALVTLRLLSSEVYKLLGPRSNRVRAGELHTLESLLAIIDSRIEEWQSRWLAVADQDGCHPFLIQFYGTHLRLQLFSLPLQEILGQSDQDVSYHMEALWVSHSSALEMLNLICRHASCLYFAQDSVHVMTAYSAAFLIKLLMSTPENIAGRIEPSIKDAISAAAVVFSHQHAPNGSSCALQTRFLENVVSKFRKNGDDQAEGSLVHREHGRASEYEARNRATWDPNVRNSAEPGPSVNQDHETLTFETAEELTWASLIAEAGFGSQDEFAFF